MCAHITVRVYASPKTEIGKGDVDCERAVGGYGSSGCLLCCVFTATNLSAQDPPALLKRPERFGSLPTPTEHLSRRDLTVDAVLRSSGTGLIKDLLHMEHICTDQIEESVKFELVDERVKVTVNTSKSRAEKIVVPASDHQFPNSGEIIHRNHGDRETQLKPKERTH